MWGFYSLSFSSLKIEQTLILHCSASWRSQLPKNLLYFIAELLMAWDVFGKMVIIEHWCILRHSNTQLGWTVGNLLPQVCFPSTIHCCISTAAPCSAATSQGCRLLSLIRVCSLRNHFLSFQILESTTTVHYLHLWRSGSSHSISLSVAQGGLSNLWNVSEPFEWKV